MNVNLIVLFISRHPLFSLLALLLEKCEQATQGYVSSNNNNSSNSSSASSPGSTNGHNNNENDSFSRDIQVSGTQIAQLRTNY